MQHSGARPLLDLLAQHLPLGPSMFGFDGQKGRLQPGEVADLLVGDLLGVGRHGLHKGGPLGAKLLDQSDIPGHRGMVIVHRVVLSDPALPNPPAAIWQQGPDLPSLDADFYNGCPWGASFCTLPAPRRMGGSPALPSPATLSTPSRRSGSHWAGCGGLPAGDTPRPGLQAHPRTDHSDPAGAPR